MEKISEKCKIFTKFSFFARAMGKIRIVGIDPQPMKNENIFILGFLKNFEEFSSKIQ